MDGRASHRSAAQEGGISRRRLGASERLVGRMNLVDRMLEAARRRLAISASAGFLERALIRAVPSETGHPRQAQQWLRCMSASHPLQRSAGASICRPAPDPPELAALCDAEVGPVGRRTHAEPTLDLGRRRERVASAGRDARRRERGSLARARARAKVERRIARRACSRKIVADLARAQLVAVACSRPELAVRDRVVGSAARRLLAARMAWSRREVRRVGRVGDRGQAEVLVGQVEPLSKRDELVAVYVILPADVDKAALGVAPTSRSSRGVQLLIRLPLATPSRQPRLTSAP